MVPPDAFYDEDRAFFYELAGDLALAASTIQSREITWAKANTTGGNAAADYYLKSLSWFGEDGLGRRGASLAWALAQSGRAEQALTEARKIASLHPGSAEFQINFARLACATGHEEEGLAALEHAIARLGFTNNSLVGNFPELPQSSERFKQLLEVEFEAIAGNIEQQPGARVFMHSAAARRNVTLTMTYPLRQPAGAFFSTTETIPTLAVDDAYLIRFDRDALPLQNKDGSITDITLKASTPQGVLFDGTKQTIRQTTSVRAVSTDGLSADGVVAPLPKLELVKKLDAFFAEYAQLRRNFPPFDKDVKKLRELAVRVEATTRREERTAAAAELREQGNQILGHVQSTRQLAFQRFHFRFGMLMNEFP